MALMHATRLDNVDGRNTASFGFELRDELVQYSVDLVRAHKKRAARHPLKHLLTPHKLIMAGRIKKIARQIQRLADENSHIPDSVASSIWQQISRAPLPAAVRGEVAGALLAALSRLDKNVAKQFVGIAQRNKGEFFDKLVYFSLMQSALDLESALSTAEELLASNDLTTAQRSFLTRQPVMLLSARKLVAKTTVSAGQTTKNRVAYIAASSLPYNVTGYTTRTHGVAKGYQGIGLDVQVITRPSFPLNFHKDLPVESIPAVDEIDGVPYHRILKPTESRHDTLEWVKSAADALEQKIRALQPEIVVAASNFMNSLPALIAAKRLGLPFAYEVRGMWELTRESKDPGYNKTPDYAVTVALESFVAQQADVVLTLTEPMKTDLISRGVDPRRIHLMPNGVDDASVFSPEEDRTLAEKLKIPAGIPVIGYVGSIIEYEGLPDLARASVALAKKGYDFRLLIVGSEKRLKDGTAPITDEIQECFRAAGLSDKLIMPGRVPFETVSSYYSLIEIAPIPRLPFKVSEMVSPIKPIEALAMGKVLIVSNVEALKDFAQAGETGLLFEKGNVADLEAKIRLALDKPELRSTLKVNAQQFVRENRTWSAICERAAGHLGLERV
ncbi:glycosyltransferase family 4 protein [Rhizobium sp. S96]|uniref:glycosyltransferase family 4 protein n=1 Tax=Rhizobium sp. S96 TaxID=3055140 RepID=UPI0025AB04E1|nr:glycosyltransferase family 4 protein [Rhizobium sp. S96]MDM9620130.1 glycosyltransferase family 4 protein [Rhizobium sp. S96]